MPWVHGCKHGETPYELGEPVFVDTGSERELRMITMRESVRSVKTVTGSIVISISRALEREREK